jgi:hypothetical protein
MAIKYPSEKRDEAQLYKNFSSVALNIYLVRRKFLDQKSSPQSIKGFNKDAFVIII